MRVELICNNIEQLLDAHPVGRGLCLEMLSRMATFWREFCGEIADFYRFLLVSSHGTDNAVPPAIKEQCWSVMLKMVRVFFSCSRKVRLVAEHGWSSPDPTSMYLWGTLQGHKIMEEFRQYNFHEHPKVYPQIVMFLFKTYVSKADVGRLRDSSVDAARRCATAETEVKVLKRNYDALVARVNKLERNLHSDPKRKGKKDIEEIA